MRNERKMKDYGGMMGMMGGGLGGVGVRTAEGRKRFRLRKTTEIFLRSGS